MSLLWHLQTWVKYVIVLNSDILFTVITWGPTHFGTCGFRKNITKWKTLIHGTKYIEIKVHNFPVCLNMNNMDNDLYIFYMQPFFLHFINNTNNSGAHCMEYSENPNLLVLLVWLKCTRQDQLSTKNDLSPKQMCIWPWSVTAVHINTSLWSSDFHPWSWRAAGCAAFCFRLNISNQFRSNKPGEQLIVQLKYELQLSGE